MAGTRLTGKFFVFSSSFTIFLHQSLHIWGPYQPLEGSVPSECYEKNNSWRNGIVNPRCLDIPDPVFPRSVRQHVLVPASKLRM